MSFKSFVKRKRIKQKFCMHYIKDGNNSDNRCHCGKGKKDHIRLTTERSDLWIPQQHIDTSPCLAFGELKMETLKRTNSPYICLSDDTDADVLWELLTVEWQLPVPQLLIIVVGQRWKLLTEEKPKFQNGLLKVAKSTGAWIITNGLATGTTELIGEAVKEHNLSTVDRKITTIGIAPWGKVVNSHSLIGSENQSGLFPALYLKNKGKDNALAQNHTHFILVDDGTVNHAGKADKLRWKIEQKSREKNVCSLLIIIGDHDETLDTVPHAAKNGIPFMFINPITEMLAKGLADCIHLCTKFKIHDQLENTIIKAALKAFRNDSKKLKTALKWNCFENVEKIINDTKEKLEKQTLIEAFKRALLADNKIFVDFILNEEILNLTEFLTYERLRELYISALHPSADESILLCKALNTQALHSSADVSILLCKALNTQQTSIRAFPGLLYHIGQMTNRIFQYVGNPYEECLDEQNGCTFEYPEKELFLWAILTLRTKIADSFWRLGDEQIVRALAASEILRYFHHKRDIPEKEKYCYRHYEILAEDVLEESYNLDKQMSRMLLVREAPLFGKTSTTVFRMAKQCMKKEFMGTSCCQTKLTEIWMGNMDIDTSLSKIFFSTFMLPLIMTIRFYKEEACQCSLNLPQRQSLEVGCLGDNNNSISPLSAAYNFFTAPVTIMFYNLISFVVYIGIFSYFVLSELNPADHPNAIGKTEYVLMLWTVMLVCETIREIFNREQITVRYRFFCWLRINGNWLELLMYILFLTAVLCRFVISPENFVWARFTYCVTLSLCYLKFMSHFRFTRSLGSQVIMIRFMLLDKSLWFFFLLLMLFTLNFGIAYHAILYPATPFGWKVITNVVYTPYWQLYGELFLDELGEQASCSADEKIVAAKQCSEYSPLVLVFAAMYMVLANIILLDLLIALFSTKFEQAQKISEIVWQFFRYRVVYAYYNAPFLPPPFIFLLHIYRTGKYLFRWCKGQHIEESNAFVLKMHSGKNTYESDKEKTDLLRSFEGAAVHRTILRYSK